MSSVNYKKLKGGTEVAAMLRHSDEIERIKHEHSNKEIDKNETEKNINIYNLNYKDSLEKYRKRVETLDKNGNRNKRKDRVTCFGLSIPATNSMDKNTAEKFLMDCYRVIADEYGEKNIVNAYIHMDEIHEYIDEFEIKKSRPHLHIYIVPEHEDQLNGKWFSSKAMMKMVNKSINELCIEKYHDRFLTGEKVRNKTVEQLKDESNRNEKLEKFNDLLHKHLFDDLKKMLKDKEICKMVLKALQEIQNEKNIEKDEHVR